FGCGIIGLDANATARDNHLAIIKEIKPPIVVVAAGTIDLAKEVMGYGDIKTFLHTPSPLIFSEAIETDVRYLVLEGMECGGHIGILTSFVLWELSLHQLVRLQDKIKASGKKINVAFAGGIGDRFSAAMVAVIASALPELMNGALWVGTAYILTEEIVDTGAVKPLYREQALDAKKTVLLGETVSIRARTIPTPYAKVIVERELERIKEGMSLKDRKHQFERDNLGSTRIAALGEIWNPDGEDDKPNRFVPIDEKGQYEKGNYMIGQIVGSLRSIRTVKDLHMELIKESKRVVSTKAKSFTEQPFSKEVSLKTVEPQIVQELTPIPDDILQGEGVAIVGLGGVFPDALNIDKYWKNIVSGHYSIKEIPKERWSDALSLYYDPDPLVPDKTYAKVAATIDDFVFNSLEFKIPPKVALRMDRVQQFALVAAKEALIDANLLDKDNTKTAVIIGNSMGGSIRVDYNRRIHMPETYRDIERCASFNEIGEDVWTKVKEEFKAIYEEELVSINEDSMPGELSNVIAGRVANVFNLRGKNMTCDAACASSLAALNISVKGLLDNEYDVKFAKIGAISAEGSYPFDERANGFVMGEGAGFVVLKRLSDAERDGDKIYAVIRGLGAASDGKGKGITAPNPIGQKLAIQRAFDQAGVSFPDIQLIEAHGTATGVGDVVEMAVLNEMAEGTTKSSIVISSVKSQIGHLKSAAGIASTIKTVLALYHKKLPPTANFKYPNPKVAWDTSPFYVTTETKDWPQPTSGHRIAGVSSFGFGGTNYHAVMEEYIPGETIGHLPKLLSKEEFDSLARRVSQMTSQSAGGQAFTTVFDESSWKNYYDKNIVLETEPLFVGGASDAALLKSLEVFITKIPKSTFALNGTGTRIHDISQETMAALSQKKRIGLVSKSLDDLPSLIDSAISGQKDKAKRLILRNKGIFYGEDHTLGKIAFMFPGQGSQYVRMGKELWDKYDIVKDAFREADEVTQAELGFSLTEIIFAIGKDDAESKELLRKTEVTQPAIFAVNIGIYRLLRSFGIKPDFVAGHSLGEYAALVASGIVSFKDGLMAVIPRGKAMSLFDTDDNGMMASVSADHKTIDKVLKSVKGYAIAANKNTPSQTVISGETAAITEVIKIFMEQGITAIPLPVSAAFHSEIVAPAEKFLRESLEKLTYSKPSIALSSNVTGGIYPETRQEIIDLLCKQVYSPVEWMKQITNMYEEHGVRTFIEIGPKYVLTSFAKSILEDKKDIVALASNHPKRGGMQHFNEVVAALGAFGYPLKIPSKDDSIYSEEFRNPTKGFFKKKAVSITPIAPSISKPQIITKESPFDVLAHGDLAAITKNDDFNDYLKLQAPAINAFLKAGYDTYKNIIAKALETKKEIDKLNINTDAVGVTGIAIGLPGKNRKVFDDSNFDAILSGENFIEKLPASLKEKIVEKNIVRLVKDAVKGAQFQSITDVSEVIKLAAQKGEFDLTKEYGVQAEYTEILDVTFQLSLAAGIEALKDAGIPLMPLKIKTSVGKEISKGWVLPESMRDDTGIVFASAFPAHNNLISIVSKSLADKYASKHKEDTILLFDELIKQISNKNSREKVTEWFEKNKAALDGDKDSKYQFSRKFLFEVLSMGHSQFAQFIRARGPNTQVNAACSSTTVAIGIAEDWIRNGRCKRVIVIAADDITSEETFQWFGSGFLAVGAATTSDKVEEAALPFDNRRHGMIVGMGAVGIVLESESSMNERGIKPIVDLMGTHLVNSAFHGTRLDREHISSQMNNFMTKIEKRFNISRDDIAKQLVFVSHETYTPARGGSASAEIDALRKTFGTSLDKVVIANTKGFTGHAMGAGIEDVVAVKILEKGIIPPVANFKEVDPELGILNLSKGGKYDVKYALRFSAGFGSQLAMVLYRLNTASGRFDSKDYDGWLASIGGSRSTMKIEKRTLRMTEDPNVIKALQSVSTPRSGVVSASNSEVVTKIISLLSEKTGYPADMIEADMHLEEDLGIDTVKQAELFGMLRTQY
ncbi:MAG: beta-ketoacyl synthase N-terminal-like domain-containing protein, partial [Candidatus Heimdallarchaeota archaeon]